jgi:sugar lactone lactonase YvrE
MAHQIVARPFFRPPSGELRYLPECPRQLRGTQLLAWVAIQHGAEARSGSLNVLNLETLENISHALPGRPGFFAETAEPGILIVGMERRLVRFDLARGVVLETLAELPEDPRVIINDGVAVPGGVIFGTKHLEFKLPIAALYHWNGTLRELRGGQICSNGKFLRGDVLIDIDTQPKTITAYRYHTDAPLEVLRLVIPPEKLPSLPDGLRPAADGRSIVVAYYNPAHTADGLAQQLRLNDGAVEREWVVPGSPRVTCPEFVEVGGKRQILFTTAVEGMPAETAAIAPHAGTMFIADVE